MKFVSKPVVEVMYDRTRVTIDVDNRWKDAVLTSWDVVNDLNDDYTVKVTKTRQKRSLDANAYAWLLIGKLAQKLHITDVEVYRNIIRGTGIYDIVPIREDLIDRWTANWQSNGIGWLCEDLGECKLHKGYHNIRCFYGSSRYSASEMSHFIDLIILECIDQGIETMTLAEIETLKKAWGVNENELHQSRP